MRNARQTQIGLVALGSVALLCGLLLYLAFRHTAYISLAVSGAVPLDGLRRVLRVFDCQFTRYYLPDFLWAFSLSCGLHSIFLPSGRGAVGCTVTVFGCGCAYEILQRAQIIGGTGDLADAILYMLAGIAVNIIYLKRGVWSMKRLFSVVLAVLLIAAFGAFALGSGDSSTTDQGSGAAAGDASTANLGDCHIEIKSCRLAKNYEGKDVVIVMYGFTNHADEAQSFSLAVDDEVYQDGVGLNDAYVLADSANYSADNQTKEIKKGASLDVEVAYELNDSATDIEVEIKGLFSFDDSVVKKTFSLK